MGVEMMLGVGAVFMVLIMSLFIFVRRIGRGGTRKKGRTRLYVPPDEAKQMVWREREIARRIQREQDNAYERVKLRNETLKYYEIVKRRHAIGDGIADEGTSEYPGHDLEDYIVDHRKGMKLNDDGENHE